MQRASGRRPSFRTYLVVITMGIILYAIVTVRLNVLILPNTELTAIRPSVVVPMLIGFLFGPLAGFLTGFFGNVLGDAVTYGQFYWTWDIGNGVMGAIPGLAFMLMSREDRLSRRGRLWSVPLAISAAFVGMSVAALLDSYFHVAFDTSEGVWNAFISAAATDVINGAVLLPLLLLVYAHLADLAEKKARRGEAPGSSN